MCHVGLRRGADRARGIDRSSDVLCPILIQTGYMHMQMNIYSVGLNASILRACFQVVLIQTKIQMTGKYMQNVGLVASFFFFFSTRPEKKKKKKSHTDSTIPPYASNTHSTFSWPTEAAALIAPPKIQALACMIPVEKFKLVKISSCL